MIPRRDRDVHAVDRGRGDRVVANHSRIADDTQRARGGQLVDGPLGPGDVEEARRDARSHVREGQLDHVSRREVHGPVDEPGGPASDGPLAREGREPRVAAHVVERVHRHRDAGLTQGPCGSPRKERQREKKTRAERSGQGALTPQQITV